MTDHRRNGVTLIEVLTTIGIVGLLLSILIPAVQSVRAVSQRISCTSNLHQIILACHSYSDVYGVFPAQPSSATYTHIAPFIEMGDGHSNILACPTDPYATGIVKGQRISYYPNNGVYEVNPGDGFSGYRRDHYIGPNNILDGLTNTAAFAERLAWPPSEELSSGTAPNRIAKIKLRSVSSVHSIVRDVADECDLRAGGVIGPWVDTYYYNHILPPNHNSCVNDRSFTLPFCVSAVSEHSGGANIANVDGSVRFQSEGIDRTVWWAIGTRAKGD